MQIENIKLLELFMETVCRVQGEQTHSTSMLAATNISTLAQQLGGNLSLMDNLAEYYECHGEIRLAQATRRLVNALKNENLLSSPDQDIHTRLLEYVYPVV